MSGRDILIVEDEAIIALSERLLLERQGYSVATVGTAEQAIDHVRAEHVDLILMDIDLGTGRMDGTEAAQQILTFRDLPIVFLTSHSEKEMVDRVRGITRYGYVLKGSGEFVLFQAIEMAFELFDARREAQHKERMLMTALEHSHAGIAIAEAPDGALRYVNKAGLWIRGRDPEAVVEGVDADAYVRAWNIRDLNGRPLGRDEVPLARAVLYGEANDRRFIVRRDNGEDRIVSASAAPVYDGEGNVTDAIVVFLDTTDEYEKDEQVRWHSSMLEAAGDAIIATDTYGTVQYMNRAAEELYGWSREIACGTNISDVTVPATSAELAAEIMAEIKDRGQWSGEFVVCHRSGKEFVARVSNSVLRDENGEALGVIGVSHKVSDHPSMIESDGDTHYLKRELYDLIRSDRAIFDFLQAGSLDGIWYWDLENQEHEWMSPRFWEVLGFDPRAMKHSPAAWQDLIHPDDLQVATDNFRHHLEDPDHPYDQIVRYTHANGGVVWIRCRGIAIRNPSGQPVRMLGAHNDVTSVKENELLRQDILGSVRE